MKTKIQIKSAFGNVLFEYEKEDNTIKDTLIEAIKNSADLRSADLRSANLRSADLSYADLRYADLRSADLSSADLRSANLRSANLRSANLRSADLSYADLSSADLRSADLRSANLRSADLRYADLRYADLRSANGLELEKIKKFFWILPEEGSFIAYKKLKNGIAKLEIPAEAKRTCNITNRKCRAEFVKVLEIKDENGKQLESGFNDISNNKLEYKVGEHVYPDKYNDDFKVDCSNGIHFFLTRQEAED